MDGGRETAQHGREQHRAGGEGERPAIEPQPHVRDRHEAWQRVPRQESEYE